MELHSTTVPDRVSLCIYNVYGKHFDSLKQENSRCSNEPLPVSPCAQSQDPGTDAAVWDVSIINVINYTSVFPVHFNREIPLCTSRLNKNSQWTPYPTTVWLLINHLGFTPLTTGMALHNHQCRSVKTRSFAHSLSWQRKRWHQHVTKSMAVSWGNHHSCALFFSA